MNNEIKGILTEEVLKILEQNKDKHLAVKIVQNEIHIFDIKRLWKESSNFSRINVMTRDFDLDSTFPWFLTTKQPTVREILSHMKRIIAADLTYPILLHSNGNVLDGMHRIAKAVLEEKESVCCIRFKSGPKPDWIVKTN